MPASLSLLIVDKLWPEKPSKLLYHPVGNNYPKEGWVPGLRRASFLGHSLSLGVVRVENVPLPYSPSSWT